MQSDHVCQLFLNRLLSGSQNIFCSVAFGTAWIKYAQ
jgi:hypothetical protein